MRSRRGLIRRLCPGLLALGCLVPLTCMAAVRSLDWRRVATPADRERLRNWRGAWVSALELARTGGAAKTIAANGALFDPDRAVANVRPPAGDYVCRVYKLGGRGPLVPAFSELPPAACRITDEGELMTLFRVGGAQRPIGTLFSDTDARLVFLGTMVLGDEKRAIDYGRDRRRDMAGVFERIGPKRWRLALPYPQFESTLDLVELVPAP